MLPVVCHSALSSQNLFSEGPFPLTLLSPSQGSDTLQSSTLACSLKCSLCRPLYGRAEGLLTPICPAPPQANSSSSDVWLLCHMSALTTQGRHPAREPSCSLWLFELSRWEKWSHYLHPQETEPTKCYIMVTMLPLRYWLLRTPCKCKGLQFSKLLVMLSLKIFFLCRGCRTVSRVLAWHS